MKDGNTPSERLVADLCERPFLRLWAHSFPKGKDNEDICDCLVVFGLRILIISMKGFDNGETGDDCSQESRQKAAIEESASGIRDAKRRLDKEDEIIRQDGQKIALPERGVREYHRLSVLPGHNGCVPLKWGALGNGFVHVCDEYGIGVVFAALDTITDLLEFLQACEALAGTGVTVSGGIEDLAALYISRGYTFNLKPGPSAKPDSQISVDGLWRCFSNSVEYIDLQNELKFSYGWDRLIDSYVEYLLRESMPDVHGRKVTKYELALASMAFQPRRTRAVLAKTFIQLLENPDLKSAARPVRGYADTAFVFLVGKGSEREYKSRELSMRCLVVRGKLDCFTTVVGIAVERLGALRIGRSSAISYLYIPEWTSEYENRVVGIQADLGYFNNVDWQQIQQGEE